MVYRSGQIFLPFCHNTRVWQTDRRTDRQTDRILIARPRLHCMQRGKNTATWKVVELTASDERIPTKGVVQNKPWPTHPIDVYDTTDSYPGSCHPKSAKTTDNIAVRAGLDLQTERRSYASSSMSYFISPTIVVHFNYIKFTAGYLL